MARFSFHFDETVSNIASSRRSFSQGAARKPASEKPGEKRLWDLLSTYRSPEGACNMTAGLSTLNRMQVSKMFTEYSKPCPSKANTQRFKNIYCNKNETEQSISTGGIKEVSDCVPKGQHTENRRENVQMPRTVGVLQPLQPYFTHYPAPFAASSSGSSSILTCTAVAKTLNLFHLVFYYGHERKICASWRQRCLFHPPKILLVQ